MTDEKIQLVLTARDLASKDVQGLAKNLNDVGTEAHGVSGKMSELQTELLGVTKEARLLHRTTAGVSKFADALDTVAGTKFTGLISDITTVAEIAGPLKNIGEGIVSRLTSALAMGVPAAEAGGLAIGGAIATGEAEGAAGEQAVAKIGGRIAAMEVPLAAEGEGLGLAIGGTMGEGEVEGSTGTGILSRIGAGIAGMAIPLAAEGTTVGSVVGAAMGAAIPLGILGAFAAAGAFVFMLPEILDHLTGNDATSKLAAAGAQLADKVAAGYDDQAKKTYAKTFTDAYTAALASGDTQEAAGQAGKDAADAWLAAYRQEIAFGPPGASDMGAEFFSHGQWKSQFEDSSAKFGQTAAELLGTGFVKTIAAPGFSDQVANGLTDHVGGAMKSGLIKAGNEAANAGAKAVTDTSLWDKSGLAIGNNLAQGIHAAKKNVKSAWDDLLWAFKHPAALARKSAWIQGKLTSQKLAEGLNSKSTTIRTQAEQTKAFLISQWELLNGRAYPIASDTSTEVQTGLASKYPKAKAQAKAFVSIYNDILAGLKTNYHVNVDVARGIAGKVSHLPKFASGGDADAGTSALVGEHGPEVVTFGRNAHVWPNGSGGGSQPIQIFLDGRKIFDVVDARMGKRLAMTSSNAYTRG